MQLNLDVENQIYSKLLLEHQRYLEKVSKLLRIKSHWVFPLARSMISTTPKGAIFVSVMAIILKTVQPQMNMFVRSAVQITLHGNADQIIENVSIVSSEHCQKENASTVPMT